MTDKIKTCGRCKTNKSIDQFSKHKASKDGLFYRCKACQSIMQKEYRERNPERVRALVRAADKKYNQSHPEVALKKKAKRYGLTLEEYTQILTANNGLCAVCNEKPATCLDHCHKTLQNRGGLCHTCNTALGLFYDRIDLLENAIKYIKQAEIV